VSSCRFSILFAMLMQNLADGDFLTMRYMITNPRSALPTLELHPGNCCTYSFGFESFGNYRSLPQCLVPSAPECPRTSLCGLLTSTTTIHTTKATTVPCGYVALRFVHLRSVWQTNQSVNLSGRGHCDVQPNESRPVQSGGRKAKRCSNTSSVLLASHPT